jgi:hypothetical protein
MVDLLEGGRYLGIPHVAGAGGYDASRRYYYKFSSLTGTRTSPKEPLRYAIHFENVETATAPAQEVVIVDQLDPATMVTGL